MVNILTNFAGYLIFTVNMLWAGRLGEPDKVAAVGLGNAICNMLVLALMLGVNGGLGMMNPRDYLGNNMELCGKDFNRGRVISATAFIPGALIVIFLGQDILNLIYLKCEWSPPSYTVDYMILMLPSMFFQG